MTMLKRISYFIDQCSTCLARGVSWLVLLMMLATATLVVLRYSFSIGSLTTQDSIMYMHVTVFMLTMSATLKNNGHVRVDIFYQRFSTKTKALVNLLGSFFLLLPFCFFMFFISFNYVLASWQTLETSPDSGLPLYLIKSLLLLLPVTLALQGLSEGIKSWLLLFNPVTSHSEDKELAHD